MDLDGHTSKWCQVGSFTGKSCRFYDMHLAGRSRLQRVDSLSKTKRVGLKRNVR